MLRRFKSNRRKRSSSASQTNYMALERRLLLAADAPSVVDVMVGSTQFSEDFTSVVAGPDGVGTPSLVTNSWNHFHG
jgi:major membrane immunogen (membrane-anchored lipoprotein)